MDYRNLGRPGVKVSPLCLGCMTFGRGTGEAEAMDMIDRALDGLDDATRDRLLDVIFRDDAPWTLLVVSRDANVRARCSRRLLLEDGALKEVTR